MAGHAIVVRYHGPTNYRGSRWIATGPALTSDDARDGRYTRATVPYDHAADTGADNARPAAERVAETLRANGWNVALGDHGTLPDGAYVWLLDYGRTGMQYSVTRVTTYRTGPSDAPRPVFAPMR